MKRGLEVVRIIKGVIQSSVLYVAVVGMVWILVMMFLTAGDIMGRYFFAAPVKGAMELSALMLAIVGLFGLAYTQQVRGHVRIGLLVSRLPPRLQAVIESIVTLLCLFVASLLVWQGWVLGVEAFDQGAVSDVLRLPAYPFRFLISVGAFFLSAELLVNLITSLGSLLKKE